MSAIAASVTIFYNAQQVRLLRKQNNQAEKQARSRATVDVVLHEKSDVAYRAARKKFGELHDAKADFTSFACGKLTDHQEQNDVILPVLNNYEFIAAGIRSMAFDEEIYRRMKRSLVIRDWETLAP